MDDVILVNAKNLKTLEDYASCLLAHVISLQTLGGFQVEALKKGLLSEDEQEACKTICWEIKRLILLYRDQVHSVLERCEVNEDQILESLKSMANKKWGIPKGKKSKKTEKTSEQGQTNYFGRSDAN